MLPTERRQVLQQRVINGMAVATQRVRSPFQIDRVPQHDGSRYQIEAASPVALLLETAVADFTQAVEKHGTVAKLAMRQPFVLFKGLTFQKLCLPGAFRPGDHHNKMLRPGLCVVHASPQYL